MSKYFILLKVTILDKNIVIAIQSSFQHHHHKVLCNTSGLDDSGVDHFSQQLQIDQTPKKDILVVQGDWTA